MSTDTDRPGDSPGALTARLDHRRDGVPVIHASGRLDCVTAPELQHLLDDQLAARPWAIVLDLSSLSVLDPGGVQTLDYLARRAGKADIGLGLVTVDRAVIRTLVTAGIYDLLEIYPSIEAARRDLG
jgi:anti-sigma B factor antagonist